MKKQKKESRALNNIRYNEIFEEMNEETFTYCLDFLYPFCNYKVLKHSDVRKIDLLEWLYPYPLLGTIPNDDHGNEQGSLDFYLYCLRCYFENYINCVENSQADLFRKRAIELLDSAKTQVIDIDDVDDIVFIFISLFKVLDDNDRLDIAQKTRMNGTINDRLNKKDAILLKKLSEKENLTPKKIHPKSEWGERLNRDGKVLQAINYMFVNNIIFLCRILQKQGDFSKE